MLGSALTGSFAEQLRSFGSEVEKKKTQAHLRRMWGVLDTLSKLVSDAKPRPPRKYS